MLLGEVICDDIVAKLRAGLAARLQAINLEKNDGIVMAAPGDADYYVGRTPDFPNAPAVFVMEGPARYEREGAHGLLSNYEILVYLFESDQTGPNLARRLQRLSRAVIECLYDDPPKERLNHAYSIMPTRSMPGTVFEPDAEHNWRAFTTLAFLAQQSEL